MHAFNQHNEEPCIHMRIHAPVYLQHNRASSTTARLTRFVNWPRRASLTTSSLRGVRAICTPSAPVYTLAGRGAQLRHFRAAASGGNIYF